MYVVTVTVAILIISMAITVWRSRRCYSDVPSRHAVALLITACVAPRGATTSQKAQRAEMYERVIRFYLDHTDLAVRVVESSGHVFPIAHPRFRQYTFVQSPDAFSSSSQAEADAIVRASQCPGLLDGYTRIVKLTGKYMLPDLGHAVRHVPDRARIVYRYQFIWDDGQGCELFACDRELLEPIFDMVRRSPTLAEHTLDDIHEYLGVDACHFPRMANIARYARADGSFRRFL